jgi:P pilus assembly chaperone PapD
MIIFVKIIIIVNNMTLIKKTCIASLAIFSLFAQSNEIALSKNIITFEKNQNKKVTLDILNLRIENTSYIETIIREVQEPQKGTKSNLLIPLTPKEAGLFVTPNKQIIHKGQDSGLLSIINVNQNLEKERVYRIDVKPVISGMDSNSATGPAIKVLLAYDILVYVQPNNPTMTYDYNFNDTKFIIKNTGNTHFTLDNGNACDNQNNCNSLIGGNLFSQKVASITIEPSIKYVSYDIKMKGKKTKKIKFER